MKDAKKKTVEGDGVKKSEKSAKKSKEVDRDSASKRKLDKRDEGKAKKVKKDPNLPKGPKGSYMFFGETFRSGLLPNHCTCLPLSFNLSMLPFC